MRCDGMRRAVRTWPYISECSFDGMIFTMLNGLNATFDVRRALSGERLHGVPCTLPLEGVPCTLPALRHGLLGVIEPPFARGGRSGDSSCGSIFGTPGDSRTCRGGRSCARTCRSRGRARARERARRRARPSPFSL